MSKIQDLTVSQTSFWKAKGHHLESMKTESSSGLNAWPLQSQQWFLNLFV